MVAIQKRLEKFLRTSHQKSESKEKAKTSYSIKTANEYLGRKLPGSENLLSSTGGMERTRKLNLNTMEESSGSRPIQEGLVTKQTSPSIQTRGALSDVQENARTKGNEETRNDEENYKMK